MAPPPPRCSICGTTDQLLRCSSCKTVYYCSSSHQHIDWPSHRQECRQLKKNNNTRLQQLQQAVAAATLSSNNVPNNASSDANLHYQQQQQLFNGGAGGNNYMQSAIEFAPSTGGGGNVGGTPRHLSVIIGTSENEILHSQAETVSQNSNRGYFGNIDANSTTTEQMQFREGGGGGVEPGSNNAAYSAAEASQAFCQGNHSQRPQAYQHHENTEEPQQSHHYPHQAQQLQPHPQQQQQQRPHQFTLTNHNQNQIEKSSSYQIGRGDENAIGNANERRYEELCRNIINDMNQYGLSVVDDFLGTEKGLQILNEVHRMYSAGVFQDGQLVNSLPAEEDLRTIRGDKITWVKGVEPGCANVGYLINQIDAVICRANTMRNNGKLGNYNIKERTKAMVACYPGSGSHYIMHVDNPNKDGRVITAIYYLNVNWDTRRSGGVLRIFPEHGNTVADIEPKFDRLIFFWSDKRNPHEVQPAHRTRYAITVWYFDANEREAALNRCKYENTEKTSSGASANSNAAVSRQQQQMATPNSNHIRPPPGTATATSSAFNGGGGGGGGTTLANANLGNANTNTNANAIKMNLNKMANSNTKATNQICT